MSEDATFQSQDVSKIVTVLTENPALLAQIKGLIEKEEAKDSFTSDSQKTDASPVSAAPSLQDTGSTKRRGQLLCALKPYVSEGRARAIDTMMTFSQILDMMKER